MIKILAIVGLLGAVGAAIAASAPDLKRYLEMRRM